MTLKEFRSMLLGAVINIHTDHKNILGIGDSSQRRLRWISYVDEYGPTLHYIKGPNNVIADTFSRMPMQASNAFGHGGEGRHSPQPRNYCADQLASQPRRQQQMLTLLIAISH
jgi:hypothetical protein